jgi:hypothetical protein
MRLTDDLDNVIDGMRKVAIHIGIDKALVVPLRPDALELFAIGERMMLGVRALVAMLSELSLGTRARSGTAHRRGGGRGGQAGGRARAETRH